MKTNKNTYIYLFITTVLLFNTKTYGKVQISKDIQNDGVIRYEIINSKSKLPSFLQFFENYYDCVIKKELPFDKTVAFLVGISEYNHLHNLPLVDKDINEFKNFLLRYGCADIVFIAKNEVVSDTLIRRYMLDYFPKTLKKDDRFIFYYSGHADDNRSSTGYLQFQNAINDIFYKDVLPISDTKEWCVQIQTKHMLFLYDCCSSGLAFEPPAQLALISKGSDKELLSSLSGTGSCYVMTAGKKGQKTYDGWFTSALLTALSSNQRDHFITINQIYGEIEQCIASKSVTNKKTITPGMWPLKTSEGGTFVFINPNRISNPLPKKFDEIFISKGSNIQNPERIPVYKKWQFWNASASTIGIAYSVAEYIKFKSYYSDYSDSKDPNMIINYRNKAEARLSNFNSGLVITGIISVPLLYYYLNYILRHEKRMADNVHPLPGCISMYPNIFDSGQSYSIQLKLEYIF